MINVPSHNELEKMIDLIKGIIFPEYFPHHGLPVMELRSVLTAELETVMRDSTEAAATAEAFIGQLPEISRMLHTDVHATICNDPAVDNEAEVVLCYPLAYVMIHYRVAHALHKLGVKLLPRMLTEMAHSKTGIDIHPAATIGEYFCIDHGTGVVIGATSIIGNHVVIYQGVTLGARNFQYDADGHPIDQPRHPIIEDNVTIYSNASVLGRITIGHDTIIGGNVWITHDVPPHSRILQAKIIDN